MSTKYLPFSELLSHIVDNRGRTCPTVEDGIPLIATNCIRNDLLYPAYDKVRYVSDETYKTWFRGHPEPGDIIFVTKGTPGRVCLAPDPVNFCIAQDMVAVRADKQKIYPKYLFALLRSSTVQSQIEAMHVGTLIPHFKKGDFDKLILPIPDRDMQKTIGDMYFELSSKIDLNRRMNETLEAMAQALFKSWFVDFEPVRAKVEGRDAGLPKHLADLFPDAFDKSIVGDIPKGWEAKLIGDLADIIGGSTPSTTNAAFWDGGHHCWATPKDLASLRSPVLLDTERRVTDAGLAQISSGLLPPGTVLLSSRAPIGYLAISEVPVAINQGFIAMKPKKGISNLFLLLWARSAQEEIMSRANGSTFLEISKSNFRSIPVVKPSMLVLGAFERLTQPLYSKIVSNEHEARTLSAIRDVLLPKLLSGEIRVDNAQVREGG